MDNDTNTQIIKKAIVAQANWKSTIEGVVILILTLGYLGVIFWMINLGNDKVGELLVGYALFAQSLLGKYFDMKKDQSQSNDSSTSAKQ